ncbi:hypothetical protein DFJ73DRAFT_539590 [Zopfochytrium polystomum]|nr:hypothetical protein DFJ73DRAFT_539590 [Zopfochytrium polystomum]
MIVGESVWGWLAHFMLAECGKRWQSRRQLIKFPECVYSLAFSPVHRNGELQIDGDLREFCEVVADQMYSVLHENDRFGAVLKLAQDAEVPWATRKKVGPSPLAQMSQGFENSKGDFASIQKFLKVVETASKSVLDKTAGQSTQLGLLGNRTFVLQKPPSRPYWSDHFKTYIYEQVLAPAAAGNLGSADYLVKVNEIHPNLNATRTSVTAARREDLDLRFCPRPFISDVFLYVPTNADAKSGNRECFMRVVGENLLSVDLNTLRITSPTAKNSGRIVQNTFVAQSIGWDENEHTKMYMTAEAKVVGAEWDIENPPVLILECLSVKDRTGTICNDEIQPINPDRAYFKSVAEIVASGLTGFGFRLEELVDRYPNRFPLTSSLRAFLDQMKSADPSLLSKFDTAINRGLLLKRGGATEVASMQTIEELKQLQIRTGNAALQPYEERVNPPNSTFAKGVAIRVAGAVSGGAAGGGSAAAGAFALASAPLVVLSAPFLIMVGAGTAIVAAAFVAWSLSESGSKAIDYCIKTATSYEQLVKEKLEMFDIAKETIDAYRTNQDLEEALIKIKEESGKKKQDKQDKSKKATKEEKVRQEMLEEIDKCILPVVNLRKACNNCIVLLTSGVKNSGKTRAFLELMNLPIDQKVVALSQIRCGAHPVSKNIPR